MDDVDLVITLRLWPKDCANHRHTGQAVYWPSWASDKGYTVTELCGDEQSAFARVLNTSSRRQNLRRKKLFCLTAISDGRPCDGIFSRGETDELYHLAGQSMSGSVSRFRIDCEDAGMASCACLRLRGVNPAMRFYHASTPRFSGNKPNPQNENPPVFFESVRVRQDSLSAGRVYRHRTDCFLHGILYNHSRARAGKFVTRQNRRGAVRGRPRFWAADLTLGSLESRRIGGGRIMSRHVD